MILSKKQCEVIEWHLFRYKEHLHNAKFIEEKIINAYSSFDISLGGRTNIHSDTTASKALKLCNNNDEDTKWVSVIQKVYKRFEGTGIDKLLEERYFNKRSINDVMLNLHIEKTTIYRWREELLTYTMILAVQEKLIKV